MLRKWKGEKKWRKILKNFWFCNWTCLRHYGSWEPPGQFLDNCKFLFSLTQESRSHLFLGALFEKIPKVMIINLILHKKFIKQVKNIFWQHIWIPDIISFHLIGRIIYKKWSFHFFSHRYWFWRATEKWKLYFSMKI